MARKREKIAMSFLLQVFCDDNAAVVKIAVFLGVPIYQHRLIAAGLMLKKS
jgi:hypothetical protein